MKDKIEQARKAISEAEAIVILAGAGMGVDSGLPDFRGKDGFWKAYPMLKNTGHSFYDIATPQAFIDDPHLAWGFYGHRLNLYRNTQPHQGFQILKEVAESKPAGYFIFTSNVDGQFQKAGFDPQRIYECHGSIHHLQTISGEQAILSADDFTIEIDTDTLRAKNLLHHPETGELLRPNILMFYDGYWQRKRYQEQALAYRSFIKSLSSRCCKKVALIEIGAGTAIPTVQVESRKLTSELDSTYIQINPQLGVQFDIGLEMGALQALEAIFN